MSYEIASLIVLIAGIATGLIAIKFKWKIVDKL